MLNLLPKPIFLAVLSTLLLSGCATGQRVADANNSAASLAAAGASANPSVNSTTNATASPSIHYIGRMSLQPTSGDIDSKVRTTATGLAANTSYNLVWGSVSASWVLQGRYDQNFAGRSFRPTSTVLTICKTNAKGQLETSFSVPSGFGFDHTVLLVDRKNQQEVNQAAYTVLPQVALSSSEGPPGSEIQITMKGIGAASYSNNWLVLYDNKFTGWISAVTTNGTAHFQIPATGGPGKHVIEIIHGAEGSPYLNSAQSPHPKPVFRYVYTITNAKAILPPAFGQQKLPTTPGTQSLGTKTAAWVNPKSGPTARPIVIYARHLPPNQTVTVTWSRMVGSHVTSSGYAEENISLGQSTVSSDGTLAYHVTPPADLGGAHNIRIVSRSGQVLASTKYTVTPSVVSMTPQQGPVGTSFTIHLQGVGWTDTSNLYTVDYDNDDMGYVCGFNSQGDVQIHLTATGTPGWHYITLYPALYPGTDIPGTYDFFLPQLTYAADHPGQKLPGFEFAFYVTRK